MSKEKRDARRAKAARNASTRRAARQARNFARWGQPTRPFLGPLAGWTAKLKLTVEGAIRDLILEHAEAAFGSGPERHARVVDAVIALLDDRVLRFPPTPVGFGLEILTDVTIRSGYVRSQIEVWVVEIYDRISDLGSADDDEDQAEPDGQ